MHVDILAGKEGGADVNVVGDWFTDADSIEVGLGGEAYKSWTWPNVSELPL